MYYKGSDYSVLTTHQRRAAAGQNQGARVRGIVGGDGGGGDGDGVEGYPGQECLVSCYVTQVATSHHQLNCSVSGLTTTFQFFNR